VYKKNSFFSRLLFSFILGLHVLVALSFRYLILFSSNLVATFFFRLLCALDYYPTDVHQTPVYYAAFDMV